MQNAYSKLCEIESALANGNVSDAQRILAEAKGAVGDDGVSTYTYECNKCKKRIPCKLVLPFSVIDTKMCIDGAAEGDFKLIEQHQQVGDKPVEVKKEVVEVVKEESGNEEVSLPL